MVECKKTCAVLIPRMREERVTKLDLKDNNNNNNNVRSSTFLA
jgi:hypothetical protein